MKSMVTPAMAAHLQGEVTTLCTCVNITRNDGQAYYFTDHDVPVVFASQTYLPNYGFARTAVPTTLQLEVDSLDLSGIMLLGSDAQLGNLISLAVAREDVDAGLFDYARAEVFLVNWGDPTMGIVPLRRGWLGEAETNEDGTYKIEVRGLSQVFSYRIGEAYTPECRADLGDFRCKVAMDPGPWQQNNGYRQGDAVVGVISAAEQYVNLPLVNASFETQLETNPGTAVPGWVSYGDAAARWTQVQAWASPAVNAAVDGSYFIAHIKETGQKSDHAGLYQDVNLVNVGVPATALDTGQCRVWAQVWACTNSSQAEARFTVSAFDGSGNLLATIYQSAQLHMAQTKFVPLICDNQLVPAGTRTLRFNCYSYKKATDEQGCFFDGVTAAVNLPNGTYASTSQYGGVAFVALTTGTSGPTAPLWSNQIGATFQDGSVTWQCVASPRSTASVTALQSKTAFTATALTQLDGWFDDGILQWETGANAGRSIEVYTWKTGVMTIMLPPLYPVQVGDRFTVYPGCDKTRATCKTKFANIINFRGEPDVPGTDRYMQSPIMNS